MTSTVVPPMAAEQLLANMHIPPCPRVVSALVAEMQLEFPDMDKMDKLISGDVGLASAVLKTANSPFYGLSRKASAVKQAINLLGTRVVTQIVTMLALRNAFPASTDLDRFWDRSNYHAIACARIARYLSQIPSDVAFTFGLFNDCGIPIMYNWFDNYKDVLAEANKAVRPFIMVENETFGINHAIVGSALAQNWHLPDSICMAIREHHSIEVLYNMQNDVDSQGRILRAISIVADYIVNRFLEVEQDAEWNLHGPAALHRLGSEEAELDFIYSYVCDELREAQGYRA